MTADPSVSITGPSREPASGGPAAQLVVFLHGVGADGADLIELAPFFAEVLPDAAFVAPDAPFAFDMAPFGRQWFSLQDRSADAISKGVRQTAPLLDAFIDEQLALRGLGPSDLALFGFSQGTGMHFHSHHSSTSNFLWLQALKNISRLHAASVMKIPAVTVSRNLHKWTWKCHLWSKKM